MEPAAVAFIVGAPRATASAPRLRVDPLRELREHYDFFHGGAPVPPSFMRGFVERRQQIGQLELLAELVPYLSLPAVFDRADALHWCDNSSAVAASAKGYSSAVDSARRLEVMSGSAPGSETCMSCRVWNSGLRK